MPKNKIKTVSNEILPHPDLPPINFRIGQVVWFAWSQWAGQQIKCRVCDGKGKVTVNVPKSTRETTIECPECYGDGYHNGNYRFYPYSQKLTIHSIRIDTGVRKQEHLVSYMMRETSYGLSGKVYYQNMLFTTEQEAIVAAEKKSIEDMVEYEKTHVLDPETNSWREKDR